MKIFRCYQEHKRGKYSGCSIPHLHEVKTKQHKNIKAIIILELIQDYMCKKCVKKTDGENWYYLEDKIMEIIKNK